jgi:hypothetical protein
MKFYDMKFWKLWIDIFSKLWIDIFSGNKWRLIWWFYMIFAATLFFNNTFGSSIGLWWLSKSIIYMFCFIFAYIRLWKCGEKKQPVLNRPASTSRINRPGIRPFVRIDWDKVSTHSDYAASGTTVLKPQRLPTIPSPKSVRGSRVSIRGYIDDVDVWRSDLDKNVQKIIKRTEQNVQKIKDRARIGTRNRIKRDEWDTNEF